MGMASDEENEWSYLCSRSSSSSSWEKCSDASVSKEEAKSDTEENSESSTCNNGK
jgi:hypothetical protein